MQWLFRFSADPVTADYRMPMELKAIRLMDIENHFERQPRRKGDIKRRKLSPRNPVEGGWPIEMPSVRVRTWRKKSTLASRIRDSDDCR